MTPSFLVISMCRSPSSISCEPNFRTSSRHRLRVHCHDVASARQFGSARTHWGCRLTFAFFSGLFWSPPRYQLSTNWVLIRSRSSAASVAQLQ